ncbi:glycyl radical protein [Chloroflexota bacterium]
MATATKKGIETIGTRAVPKGSTFTERVKKLKEECLATPRRICGERSYLFTEYFKQSEGEPVEIRTAKALDKVLSEMSIAIHDEELIVGGQTRYLRGGIAYPEINWHWIEEEIETYADRDIGRFLVSEEDKKMLLASIEYWVGKSEQEKICALWREEVGSWPDDCDEAGANFMHPSVSTIAGRQVSDYEKVLNIGLEGIIGKASKRLKDLKIISNDDIGKRHFLEAVIISCQAVIKHARRYAELAREMSKKETNPARKKELARIAEICQQVPAGPARTFHEALQSFWLVHVALEIEMAFQGYTPGRFDQYMYPFYIKDISERRLSPEEAGELLGCLWAKFEGMQQLLSSKLQEHVGAGTNMFQNITIGGQTRDGKDSTNELSYLILDVTEDFRQTQPTITVRYHDRLSDRFLVRAAEVVRGGTGMPAFVNDKAAITTLTSYGIPIEEARNWCPVGCVEICLPAAAAHGGLGMVNIPKILDLTLSNGVDPRTGKRIGLLTGDPLKFKTFNELLEAFKKQLDFFIGKIVHLRNIRYAMAVDLVPTTLAPALVDGCIESGKHDCRGGAKYKYFAACCHPFGMVNTGNSLTAIRKLVFEEQAIGMAELLEALAANFEGKGELRQMLQNAPKYGNDDDYADLMVNEVFRTCIEVAAKNMTFLGIPAATYYAGVTFHYGFGKVVGALPDGRKAGEPLADASVSAFRGTDSNGPTAVIKSASKIDALKTFCTLFNLKFQPSALKDRAGIMKFLNLIKTYFDLYGYHIQFNVVNRETLLAAQKEPEKYGDLIVRVAGFSAYWIDLAGAVQNEIIARTEHNL